MAWLTAITHLLSLLRSWVDYARDRKARQDGKNELAAEINAQTAKDIENAQQAMADANNSPLDRNSDGVLDEHDGFRKHL